MIKFNQIFICVALTGVVFCAQETFAVILPAVKPAKKAATWPSGNHGNKAPKKTHVSAPAGRTSETVVYTQSKKDALAEMKEMNKKQRIANAKRAKSAAKAAVKTQKAAKQKENSQIANAEIKRTISGGGGKYNIIKKEQPHPIGVRNRGGAGIGTLRRGHEFTD